MTLVEMFEGMRDEHLPPNMCWFIDHWEQANGMPIDDYHAESIICWAMVKALADAGELQVETGDTETRCTITLNDRVIDRVENHASDALSAAYFAAFPKETTNGL